MNILAYWQSAQTVLGLNARSLDYTGRYNRARAIRRADDKLQTKLWLKEAGLRVSPTLLTISTWREIKSIPWHSLPSSFVIKPGSSSQGRGVLVIFGKSKKLEDTWVKAGGKRVSKDQIESHLFQILAGYFSDKGDQAFFEERVSVHPALKPYAKHGTPDIRVIVCNRVPVMAELRLPTLRSQGRSNLHMGGIGVGIDLASGTTTQAIYLGKHIRFLPGERLLLANISIPSWDRALLLAVQAQETIGLGFAGIDIGIDRQGDPLVFEVNANPGLAIQNANASGLRQHLERIKGLRVKNARQGVSLAQALFGGNTMQQVEIISGKKIIGAFEVIHIETPKGLWPVRAKIDTGAKSSSLDNLFLKKLGLPEEHIEKRLVKSALGEEVRDLIPISFLMRGEKITTEATIADRSDLSHPILIGKKDLKNFLIDVNMRKPMGI